MPTKGGRHAVRKANTAEGAHTPHHHARAAEGSALAAAHAEVDADAGRNVESVVVAAAQVPQTAEEMRRPRVHSFG